jgi:hypothetical protein
MSFRTAMRAAAIDLLDGYAASVSPAVKLQTYPGRPRSIKAPTAFVDRIIENFRLIGPELQERVPTVVVTFLHGTFDSKDAVEQGDEFVDGFIAYVKARYHQAGANTLIAIVRTEDDPSFVPDWQPPAIQETYYATHFFLEGFASD